MSSDVAIRVQNVSKCYTIYDRPPDRLKQSIVPQLQRLAGRPSKNYYREFWALKDVSFSVRKGETVGIIGRNGSGKSTLLQIITGTLNASGGTVETLGLVAALLELGSGFNPQFTGRENVFLNGALLGVERKEMVDRFAEIAAFADIGDFMEQPLKTYSSGMYVRLGFAVQAMLDPSILIVDEALAVGDEMFQRKCFARLEELKRKGTSILFVSHAGPQIVQLCDRALLLERGSRLILAEPKEVIRAYQRLIYAPSEQQTQIVADYKSLDQAAHKPPAQSIKEVPKLADALREFAFDPALVPKTTTAYPPQGAEIQSVRIMDGRGQVVNLLQPGQDYQFVVSGRFLSSLERVHFGIHIRTISGVEVTGQRYPSLGEYVPSVSAGKMFRVVFNFRMILLPGTYFVGAGVWSEQQPNCRHRILDAIMFRLPATGKVKSFGYVDATSGDPILEVT